MKLYIRIKDGVPFEHPILEDNFKEAFPHVDVDNLPPEFSYFVRLDPPKAGLFKVAVHAGYEFKNGAWTDLYQEQDIPEDQKKRMQDLVKEVWAQLPNRDNFTAWFYDETTNSYQPPIPRPETINAKSVRWCGADNSWKEVDDRPNDGRQYKFNYSAWPWELE